jgi:hypothetical protein
MKIDAPKLLGLFAAALIALSLGCKVRPQTNTEVLAADGSADEAAKALSYIGIEAGRRRSVLCASQQL